MLRDAGAELDPWPACPVAAGVGADGSADDPDDPDDPDDVVTVGRPVDRGGRGVPPEISPPPAFEPAPGEPSVFVAEDGDGVDGGCAVTFVVVTVVVVTGGELTGAEETVVVGTVGTVTPGTVMPRTVTPGTVTPGTVTPGTVTPGMVTPGTDTEGVLTPGTVPAVLACGSATKIDSSAPASRATIPADLRARPSDPLDEGTKELPTVRPLIVLDAQTSSGRSRGFGLARSGRR